MSQYNDSTKDIPGWEGVYAVTEDGRVWAHPRIRGEDMSNKIVIKKTEYGSTDADPFNLGLSLRQLSKITGLDHSYLGKVKQGTIPITGERLMSIMDKATNYIMLEKEEK